MAKRGDTSSGRMSTQKSASGPRPVTGQHRRPAGASTRAHAAVGSTTASVPAVTTTTNATTATSASATGIRPVRGADRAMTGEGRGRTVAGSAKRSRPLGLRAKFMLVLAGLTVLVMASLAVSMALTTNKYLFAIKQHGGIEVARLAAQIGISADTELQSRLRGLDPSEHATVQREVEEKLATRLEEARNWGKGLESVTDIYSIRFAKAGDFLTGQGIGTPEEDGAAVGHRFTQLFIAKTGQRIPLSDDIRVYEATARIDGRSKPIYRFNIALGGKYGSDARVRVDIARESVVAVSTNLYTIITISVLVAIGVVIAVANWLAGNITRPIDLLVRDMQIVARGDLDHVTKPHSRDEIGVLAVEFNKMTQNLAGAQSALVEQEKAEYELSLAREVQRHLLPAEAPQLQGYDTAAFYQGAKAVSGDYFDMIQLGNGLWGFIVADVSGKGIPGSMVMAITRTIVRLVAGKHLGRASETLKETNKLIAKQIKRGMFVTAIYAILDPDTGVVTYSSAGHNPIVVYRHATKSYELATTKGIALGFNEGPVFDKTVQEERLQLNVGDAILLYTDGFPEAMNADNEEFGEERFYKTVAANGHVDSRVLLQGLVGAIAQHRGQAEQSDDLTIITIKRTA